MPLGAFMVEKKSFSQAQQAIAILSTFLDQQQSNVTELRTKLLSLMKSIIISCVQESSKTTIKSYYGH